MSEERKRRDEGAVRPRRGRPLTADTAWEYLLRVLARQSYTVAELRRKLRLRDFEGAGAEAMLTRLQELRLVDDATYAEQYVASRKGSRGRLGLKRELARKGIEERLANEQLEGLSASHQVAAAIALLQKHAWRYQPPAEMSDDSNESTDAGEYEQRARLQKARAKALGFLARRGFGSDAAQAALDASGWFEQE